MSNEKRKRRLCDRNDGYRVKESDPIHSFMPFMLPNRCDNEAVMSELIDLTKINEYVAKKNAENPKFKYTMFHFLCAAIAKCIYQRPKLNYFYKHKRLYERKFLSEAFIVKRQLVDSSPETLAILKFDTDSEISPIEQVHSKVEKIVFEVRHENKDDGATDIMGILKKLPKFILDIFMGFINFLDNRGILFKDFVSIDPYHQTVFLSNTGSIKLTAQYHHLANFGTNSFFVLIGQKHQHPYYSNDGSVEMKEAVELGLTIDERIADGTYFANSLKIIRKLAENPELIELPFSTIIETE